MPTEIVYETHAPTPDNSRGVISGWHDTPLAEDGFAVARELGARRREDGIAAVYSSDFARAVQTARTAFEGTDVPLFQDVRLRECNYGDLNGCTVAELDAARPSHVDVPFPGGGQSFRQVLRATEELLQEIVKEWEGRRVLIVAHSANKWSLDCLLNGARLEDLVAGPFVWQPGWEYRA